ncbi:MAG TPA: hypothetical protein VF258_07990 [Luteolibacter sp.]
MKSTGIQRSVKGQRRDRLIGDAPAIGRVARMPGTGLPKGEQRQWEASGASHDNQTRESGKWIIRTWSFLLIGVVILTLGLAISLWLIPKMASGKKTAHVTQAVAKSPSPTAAEALAMVKSALAIREPEKIADSFRLGSATPQAVVDFLKGLPASDGVVIHCDWLGSMDANDLSIDGVLVRFKNNGQSRTRLALLTPDDGGKWRIDFDAFARTVTPSWQDILANRGDAALVRIHATNDYYYNGPFRDDKQWRCYRIASPDTEQAITAYCKSGSPQDAAMIRLSNKDSQNTRVTLEIRRVEGASSRQFEISKVLAEGWILTSKPYDDRFN